MKLEVIVIPLRLQWDHSILEMFKILLVTAIGVVQQGIQLALVGPITICESIEIDSFVLWKLSCLNRPIELFTITYI